MQRELTNLVIEWARKQPELGALLARAQTPDEAGEIVCAWLCGQDFPSKPDFLHQIVEISLGQVKRRDVGHALCADYGVFFDGARPQADEEEIDPLGDWRGDSACALLVHLLAQAGDACGGLVWVGDPERGGHRTASWEESATLQEGMDYQRATLLTTTPEQLANFGDTIAIHEIGPAYQERPHRALAGLLATYAGREAAHAVLLRLVQAGRLGSFVPELYPLDAEADRALITVARRCDYRASEAVGQPAQECRFYLNHLALAGLLADVVGKELAERCMQEILAWGTMAKLKPEDFALPGSGESEWNWTLPYNPPLQRDVSKTDSQE